MKVLVTGGAGFIGSHTVVELYNAGFEPIIVDNFDNSEKSVVDGIEKITSKKILCYEADCTKSQDLEKLIIENEGIVGVIHFAAHKSVPESVNNPLKYYTDNLNSLCIILGLMKKYKLTNLIFSSSCTVYGVPDILPVTEETPIKPANSPYGNTKKICEDILKDFIQVNELKALALRYFNPIGAHPSGFIGELPIGVPTNLVPFVTQTAAGVRQQLTIFGDDYNTPDGTNIRDFIDVVDLAKAHVKSLQYLLKNSESSLYDVFNLGTGQGASVLEVVQTFEMANNLKLNYKIGPKREGDVEQIFANVAKANNVLGWKTAIPLSESLRNAWVWEKKLRNIS